MGIFITFVYDVLRIFRRVVPHKAFFVSLEDMGFWIYCGAKVFLLLYHESNGTLRWFAVLGALVGMTLYKKLVSSVFVKYVSLALIKLLGLVGRVLNWILRPFRALGRRTRRGASRAGRGLRRIVGRIARRIKMRLTFFLKTLKIGLKS